MSDSVQLHRRQPTRLSRPWDSPSKNTGVDCHFLLQCMKVKSESEVAQSCPTLSDPMDCSLPGTSTHGIFQARVLEWGAIAFSINCSYWSPKLNPCTQLKFLEFKPSGVYMAYCDLNKKICRLPPPSTYPCVGWGSMITSSIHKREEWKTQQTLVHGENSCPAVGRSLDEPQFCSCGLSALPTVASSVPWKVCPCLPSFI